MSRPLVIAHRGASGEKPENTLPAYELAVEHKADMIEIDLHHSRDGAIVIHHDEKLERFGLDGEIGDLTLAELRAIDAAPEHDERGTIPTLDEVLDGFGARVPFNLEIKRGTRADYEGLEAEAIEAVEGRGLLSRTLFSSFYDSVLGRLRESHDQARIGVLVSPRAPEGWELRAKRVGAEAVNPWVGMVNEEWMVRAHGEGLRVFPYTADDEEQLKRLIDFGVDGIFTNRPDRLRRILGLDERS